MLVEDARAVPPNTILNTDVCVIGSGAPGITIAQQLDGTGLRVLVLEAGGEERDPAAEDGLWAIEHLGMPHRNPSPCRARSFGGSTALWFGRIAMPDPIDFEHRAWVPNSGWPLSLDQLQPWLKTAVNILDVPRFEMIDIDRWPMNPTIESLIQRGGADLGVFLWANRMLMGPSYREQLEASANIRLMLNATATELVPSEDSSAIESLSLSGPDGNRFSVEAKTYVLASGGIENPRLLLASTARSTPGVGNETDLVGRYYMDHPRGEGLAKVNLRGLSDVQIKGLTLLGERIQSHYGHMQFRVKFPERLQRAEELLNHSLHAHVVSDAHQWTGYHSAKNMLRRVRRQSTDRTSSVSDDLRSLVRSGPQLVSLGARWLVRRGAPTELVVMDQMEQEPDPLSRITVDPRRKDKLGLPRVQLNWRVGESTYRSQSRMHRFFKDILEHSGVRTFTSEVLDRPDKQPLLWDMKHPSGTTRMAASAANGVVDANCRVHGMTNLYIAGSSVFPTVGHFNPTLLIVALAARLADHLQANSAKRPVDIAARELAGVTGA